MRTRILGLLVMLGTGAACGTGTENTEGGGGPELRIVPADTTIGVLGTVAYKVIALDSLGDTVAAPAVVWTATDSGIAGIGQDGAAVGRAAGITKIVATAGSGLADTAQLQVTGSVSACYGITMASKFSGSVGWGFKAVDQATDGGFFVTADDNGHVDAELTRQGNGPFLFLWTGTVSGSSNASVTQKKTDGGTGIATYTSTSGVMQPQPGGLGLPKLSLIVDAQTCTYRITTGASLATLLKDMVGGQTNSVDIVAYVQFAGVVPSDWRTNGLVRLNGTMMANSVAYAGLTPNQDVLSPLGFAAELFNGVAQAAVQASGGFHISFVE